MTIGTTDILLLVIIVSSLVVGFFWGSARSLLSLGAWLFAFLAGAHLKNELGSYLAQQWTNFPPAFSDMAAYGIIFVGLMAATPLFILTVTRGSQRLSRYQVVDDLAGALLAVLVSVLFIASLLIVLATFYGTGEMLIDNQGGPDWTANLYQSLLNSNIGSTINDVVVPVIGAVLGPILPADVREVFG
jgi:uncharacterized membrane protein required for colicin V production